MFALRPRAEVNICYPTQGPSPLRKNSWEKEGKCSFFTCIPEARELMAHPGVDLPQGQIVPHYLRSLDILWGTEP